MSLVEEEWFISATTHHTKGGRRGNYDPETCSSIKPEGLSRSDVVANPARALPAVTSEFGLIKKAHLGLGISPPYLRIWDLAIWDWKQYTMYNKKCDEVQNNKREKRTFINFPFCSVSVRNKPAIRWFSFCMFRFSFAADNICCSKWFNLRWNLFSGMTSEDTTDGAAWETNAYQVNIKINRKEHSLLTKAMSCIT